MSSESTNVIVLSALVGGATAIAKSITSQVVRDGYANLKEFLIRRFSRISDIELAVNSLERAPQSTSRARVLEEELVTSAAARDIDVQRLAESLMVLLKTEDTTIRTSATLSGNGAIAQGDGAKAVGAGGVIVNGDVSGNIITGNINTGNIDTGGGAYVGGDLNTGGGTFVGRDQQFINNYYGRGPTENAGTKFSETGHKLYAVLKDKWFSESDLQDLCFQIDIDWDALSGDNKIDKARSLVLDCEKSGRLPRLLSMVRLARPNLRDQIS